MIDQIVQAIKDGFAEVARSNPDVARKVVGGVQDAQDLLGNLKPELLEQNLNLFKGLGTGATELTEGMLGLVAASKALKADLNALTDPFFAVGQQAKEAAIQFNAATGFGGEFDDAIFSLRESLKGFPVDAQDVTQATQQLSKGFSDFTLGGISPAEERIAKTVTILGKLGASIEDQTTIVQGLRKGFSQSDAQINMSLKEFEALADTLNVDLGTVMSNFAAQIPLFGAFGDNAVSTFRRLQAQSKGTGLELNKLVGISEKFTTFEGAAGTIGQLNQLLGDTGLLPTDLVAAALEDPAEAVSLLQDALGGFDVENLGGGMKRVLADILGFGNDITGFISFARGSTDALEDLGMQAAKTDTELLDSIRKGTDPGAMATAMGRLGFSVDGVAEQISILEDATFAKAITGAETLREEMGAITLEAVRTNEAIQNILKSAGESPITSLADTASSFTGVDVDAQLTRIIEAEREEMKKALVDSVSNIQVHVYLDRSQLAQQIAAEFSTGGM